VKLRHAFPIAFLSCLLAIPHALVAQGNPGPSDGAISFWVREALLKDPRTETADITVGSDDGIVTLVGDVPTLSAKRYAELEAQKITGVRGVVNELFVTPSLRFDADIAQDVRKRLITSASLTSDGLRVAVHQGNVQLDGSVASWAERQEAELLAGAVRGVKAVTNKLVVQYPNTRPDAEIQRDVVATLARDVYLTGLPITASVKEGVVTLEGEVGTAYEKQRAADDAHLIWNVVGVDNHLTVTRAEMMPTRQKSPTPTDDQLAAAVRDALATDQRLALAEVTAHVQHGEVTLHGTVLSNYQKRIAAQVAQDVVGVSRVTNRLTVQTAQRNDADIQADVQLQLETDAFLAPGSLGVRSHNGIVTLTGNVNNNFEKLHATDAVSRVKGVRDIVNNIMVSTAWDTDAAIARRIKDFLATNAELQGVVDQIHVAVNQGVVTLTGTVNFGSERDAAGEAAFETEGVRRVDNQLAVASAENTR
jgi:osmotically-inducible protein OsmY